MLRVGDDAGIEIRAETAVEDVEFSQAVQQKDENRRKRTVGEIAEGTSDDASRITAKIEHTKTLCTEVISGEVSLDSIGNELDALVGLLSRLDREGRWEEELRLARCTAKLLALAKRWLDLLNWLRAALQAAEKLEDSSGKAWAMHELGTLHVAAGKHAEADRLLTHARDLRERGGERRGVALTERNLNVLCRTLRARLHDKQRERLLDKVARRPIIALGAVAVLLAVGGSGGAVIARSHGKGGSSQTTLTTSSYGPHSDGHSATVNVSFSPLEPHANEQVTFRATATDRASHIALYKWDFGDGDPNERKLATHSYRRPGTYKVLFQVSDAQGKTIGEASASINVLPVARPTPSSTEGPTAKFLVHPALPLTEQQASFDAGESSAGTGSIVSDEWDFGDGRSATGRSASHSYEHVGPYRVKLTVTNSHGKTGTVVHLVNVKESQGQTSKLTLSCPKSLPFGKVVSIAGSLSPPQAEAPIQLTVSIPTEERVQYKAVTSPEGAFEVKIESSGEGRWTVLAESDASGTSKPTSDTCAFTVEPKETAPAVTTTTE